MMIHVSGAVIEPVSEQSGKLDVRPECPTAF